MQVSSKTIMAAVFLGASVLGAKSGCENGMYDFECEAITDQDFADLIKSASFSDYNKVNNFAIVTKPDLCLDPYGRVKYRGLTSFD